MEEADGAPAEGGERVKAWTVRQLRDALIDTTTRRPEAGDMEVCVRTAGDGRSPFHWLTSVDLGVASLVLVAEPASSADDPQETTHRG